MPDRSPSPSEVASNSSSGFQHSVLSDLQERDALGIAAQNVTTKQGVGNGSLRDLHPALTRLRSQESVSNGSPRTSGDLYSSSNHSTETVASEYPSANLNRAGFRPSHQRFASTATITPVRGRSEHLLMGYASVNGSFTLDGGLVDQSHFEDIRAFGVVGGSGGGGVVGYEGQKAATGLLGGFGWGRISESLGGFLGKNEPSSIREMSYDSSNTGIPILSTPQSLLFVDQTLQPGQSQAYTFRFRLPESLPSSYRGRAIKIAYNLVVGIQRPADGGQQGFIKAEIPIRVLASTRPGDNNSVYDLREPTRLLRDTAVARSIDSTHSTYESVKTPQPDPPASKQPGKKDGLTDFLEYVKALQQHDDGAGGLLSPDASMPPTPSAGPFEGPSPFMPEQTGNSNARAIEKKAPELESPQTQFPAKQSLFTIKRADQFVATLHLSKAQYKLNDTLRLTLDFREPSPPASLGPTEKTPETFLNDPDTPSPTSTSSPPHSPHQSTSFPAQLLRPNSLKTFATAFTLLTSETVDPTLALRSKATTERLTRKIWAEGKEWVADCALTSWETVIGGTGKDAYPTIRTSAVGMQWQLKIAFTTEKPRLGGPQAALDGPGGRLPGSAGDRTSSGTLVSTEADRMHTFSRIDAALETDQFEVLIPVHVLPAEPEELAFAGDLVAETVGYGI